MGVYIKGMTAQQARMWLHYQMPFTFIVTNDDIIEIPEPHGDLIDREEVFKVIEHETLGSRWGEEIGTDEETYIGKFKTIDDIDMIPIVIEAEGEQ